VSAPDQSIAAHFPADFDVAVDEQGAVLTLFRDPKMEMIVLISQPRTDLDDAADLDRIMMKGLFDYANRNGAVMSTTITHEGKCHDFDGVISTSTLSTPNKEGDIPQKVVGCSALRSGRSYFFAYFVPEFLAEKEEPELLRIINATDVFELPSPAELAQRAAAARNNGNDDNSNFNAFPSNNGRYPPNNYPQTTFSQRGAQTTPRPVTTYAPPRPVATYRPTTPTVPTTQAKLQYNSNGSVEYAGNTADKASQLARDQRVRDARAKNPW
jgi:hypothetical protein